MKINNPISLVHNAQADFKNIELRDQLELIAALAEAAIDCIGQLRQSVLEDTTKANRRELQRRETEVDAKTPVKPVSIAEPSKPTKPKYSGN